MTSEIINGGKFSKRFFPLKKKIINNKKKMVGVMNFFKFFLLFQLSNTFFFFHLKFNKRLREVIQTAREPLWCKINDNPEGIWNNKKKSF